MLSGCKQIIAGFHFAMEYFADGYGIWIGSLHFPEERVND
jgi:hypothetical protein